MSNPLLSTAKLNFSTKEQITNKLNTSGSNIEPCDIP